MDRFSARYAWAAGLLALLLIVVAGAVSYNVGLSEGLAQVGAGNATAAYPYGWHRHWGFGPFAPLIFILFWVVLIRGLFWPFWRPWRPWVLWRSFQRAIRRVASPRARAYERQAMKTILLVEDEYKIAEIAGDYLRRAGFSVVVAGNGATALQLARERQPDLIVLDLGLPKVDGLEVTRTVRRESNVPIIMLTARVDEDDRLLGLEVGADDYITKPFSPRELVARVQAVLRRVGSPQVPTAVVQLGDLTLDVQKRKATRAGESIDLTATEFELLATMARQPGRVFTRAQLLDSVRGHDVESFDRAIDAHVKNIRRKIESDPRNPRYIETVYGIGYRCAEA